MKLDLTENELLLIMNMMNIGKNIFKETNPIISNKLDEILERWNLLDNEILNLEQLENLIKGA